MNVKFKIRFELSRMIICGLLCAMGVILGGMLSIPAFPLGAYSVKIGFGVLPVILAGVMYGPMYGGLVGGLTDFLQAILFPKGAYVPWFTVIGILFGLIPGLFFRKGQKPTFLRLFFAVFAGQTIGSVILNTLLMVTLYGLPLMGILPLRAINQAVMIPIYTGLVYALVPVISRWHPGWSVQGTLTTKDVMLTTQDVTPEILKGSDPQQP